MCLKRNIHLFLCPRANVAKTTASSGACYPGGGSMPTGCVQPSAPAGHCTVITNSGQLRRDPNPPSYDQAVAGKDISVILEEGLAKVQGPAAMETVASNGSPPVYTPVSEPTNELPLASPAPLPTYSAHVSDDGMLGDDDPLD